MTSRSPALVGALGLALACTCVAPATAAAPAPSLPGPPAVSAAQTGSGRGIGIDLDVRFSTFNASLNRGAEGQLISDLSTPGNEQARNVAETIQRAAPDVVLINEFDYDSGQRAANLFRDNYLQRSQRGAEPATYPYMYTAPVNTGVPSGMDLNNDGKVGGPDDAYGFGAFPGQYGMVVYSKYPIDTKRVRTFQNFLWKDMPGALLPDDPATPGSKDWYSPAELQKVRLSSKSHWDVPINLGGRTVHLLASHPTPPTFDGPEDRNGKRNHDEIRLWADYISGSRRSGYIYDDRGRRGGLPLGSSFVIAGDQNSDPNDGDSVEGSIEQLLDNLWVNTSRTPTSEGAVEQARLQGGVNATHRTPSKYDTADFSEPPGNIRADYVLPSITLPILKAGVFWPTTKDPLSRLTGTYPFPTSDHRLVHVDVFAPHLVKR